MTSRRACLLVQCAPHRRSAISGQPSSPCRVCALRSRVNVLQAYRAKARCNATRTNCCVDGDTAGPGEVLHSTSVRRSESHFP